MTNWLNPNKEAYALPTQLPCPFPEMEKDPLPVADDGFGGWPELVWCGWVECICRYCHSNTAAKKGLGILLATYIDQPKADLTTDGDKITYRRITPDDAVAIAAKELYEGVCLAKGPPIEIVAVVRL